MRPRSLHLKGFTAFRTMAEPVSFLEADLFALTGPTGSGKTSLLDAICFALYGQVPRLDARSVEPVISLGAIEARVLFEFSVGPQVFHVARVVRRTKTGATTAEARLEEITGGDPEVKANGADEVTAAVTDLLGLSFDQFTKAVLLPQGAFAAFLHDTPAKRQDLLRTLLDLGIYDRVRELAQLRRARAEGEAEMCRREMDRLSDADATAESRAAEAVEGVQRLAGELAAAEPERTRLTSSLVEVEARITEATGLLSVVGSIEVPSDVALIAEAIEGAVAAAGEADGAAARAVEAVDAAEKELAALPSSVELTAALQLRQRQAELVARVERGEEVTRQAEAALSAARSRLDAAETERTAAAEELARVETAHRGHALAERLQVGDLCPVCDQPVTALPDRSPPTGYDDAKRRHEQALIATRAASDEAARAAAHLESCHATKAGLEGELADVERHLDGQPGRQEVEELLARVDRASSELAGLRKSERQARDLAQEAHRRVVAVREREAEGRRSLASTITRAAAAGPPELDMVDPVVDWARLAAWARSTAEQLGRDLLGHEGERQALAARLSELDADLDGRMVAIGIPDGAGTRAERVAKAAAEAEQRLERVREDRRLRSEAEERERAARAESELARTLARHLQANGFEGWLMEEALDGLVRGANELLADLSGSAYSLRMDKRDFSVVDHRNADETRGVKTLSGGETFLVSLALALALADQIGSLAVEGAARLESMFLDEGFGTLDTETLEVVAAVIQELGATGRTVGLVTHVKELAELVPVRFEVTRGPGGSTVRRVET